MKISIGRHEIIISRRNTHITAEHLRAKNFKFQCAMSMKEENITENLRGT